MAKVIGIRARNNYVAAYRVFTPSNNAIPPTSNVPPLSVSKNDGEPIADTRSSHGESFSLASMCSCLKKCPSPPTIKIRLKATRNRMSDAGSYLVSEIIRFFLM